jgi:hypothetical protein
MRLGAARSKRSVWISSWDQMTWQRVEIWLDGKYVGRARRCDKQMNSKTYTDRDYDRPDKSS